MSQTFIQISPSILLNTADIVYIEYISGKKKSKLVYRTRKGAHVINYSSSLLAQNVFSQIAARLQPVYKDPHQQVAPGAPIDMARIKTVNSVFDSIKELSTKELTDLGSKVLEEITNRKK